MSQIAIIGAGAWGTALAIVVGHHPNHRIRLWSHDKEVGEEILRRRVNGKFLPECRIPENVYPTGNLAEALVGAEILVSVMPSQHCRTVFRQMRDFLTPQMLIVSASKGLERTTQLSMTGVIRDVLKTSSGFSPRLAALSGPSFALEAARGDPTAVTIASPDAELAAAVQREFGGPTFRLYTNEDMIGVELGGALKNVIAIAAGVCAGLGLQHNSTAALLTRGLAEITRLVVACGGKAETMSGLAGLGDLVLTCTGGLSRNRSVGVELGRGRKLPDILADMHGMVAEGVLTTDAAVSLSREKNVEMPITEQMHAILHQGKDPRQAIHDLMTRAGRSEVSPT
jgi:glycerol-3-phosphate dehydrogenase (NAD(P)+)